MLSRDEIREQLEWNDPTTYFWKYSIPSADKIQFIGDLIAIVVFPPIAFVVLGIGSDHFSETLSFWFAILVFLLFLLWLGLTYYRVLFGTKHEKIEGEEFKGALAFTCAALLLFIISSPLFFADQFQGVGTSRNDWLWYYLENISSIGTFGILSHLGVQFSTITFSEWIGSFSLSLFRGLLALGLIQSVIKVYKEYFKKHSFYGTISEFFTLCQSMYDTGEIEVVLNGRVTDIEPPLKMNAKNFLKAFEE